MLIWPLVRIFEPGDHAHRRRLAAARRAEENDELTVGNLQVDVVDADERSPPLGNPIEYYPGHRSSVSFGPIAIWMSSSDLRGPV